MTRMFLKANKNEASEPEKVHEKEQRS
jgi:hypothetical protein